MGAGSGKIQGFGNLGPQAKPPDFVKNPKPVTHPFAGGFGGKPGAIWS